MTPGSEPGRPVGTLAVVLHSHLPWLAGHGTWPVGEEWLHQAWSACYLPLVEMLHRLAADGYRDVLSLGVTPVLAAQLDDPRCLRELHGWLGRWQLRAEELASSPDRHLRDVATAEFRAAGEALDVFGRRWASGGSPVLRSLVDEGVVELLGGPATHPILPLLPDDVAGFALRTGLDDTAVRLGGRPAGIWLPECAWAPGLEVLLAANGVGHLMLDEPTLVAGGASVDRPWRLDGSDVVAVGRHLGLTDRVWSSRSGYPRGAEYRDFHALDRGSGFRPFRVTDVGSPDKAPYDPAAAADRARRDARDFVDAVRDHLVRTGGLAVVAWDAELFGHWWHEGVGFLEHVLRLLPEAGVRVRSMAGAVAEAPSVRPARLPLGSWGAGKDLRLWSGPPVADLAGAVCAATVRLRDVVGRRAARGWRDPVLDQLARETLLAAASDWTFLVSRDTAARYARERLAGHLANASRLADLADADPADHAGAGDAGAGDDSARGLAAELRRVDGPFGALDARLLLPSGPRS